MESGLDDESDTGDDKEDGENDLPGDFIGEDFLGGEKQDDAGGDETEARELFFVGEETNDAWDDNEESPPAVEKDVEVK